MREEGERERGREKRREGERREVEGIEEVKDKSGRGGEEEDRKKRGGEEFTVMCHASVSTTNLTN